MAVQMLGSNIDNKLLHDSPKKAMSLRARVPISRGGGDHGVMNCTFLQMSGSESH